MSHQVQPGDQIIDLQGRALDDDSLALQVQLALGRLNILRDGARFNVEGTWPQLCYRPVRLTSSRAVEAKTAPNGIEMSMGLIRYTQSDDELAYAIAHELSHFMLDHSRILSDARKRGQRTPSLSRSLEAEADRGAVFLMHKAGYDVWGALSFIDRSGVLRDFPLLGLSSHPRRSERIAIVEQAIIQLGQTDLQSGTIAAFVSASGTGR
ncbi:MAG: M48 family metalloprotease [Pseudomonadota bacterium]